MPDTMELLLEAERRGILPEDKKALLSEARNRGLVPQAQQGESALKSTARTFLREGLPFAGALAGGAIGLAGGPVSPWTVPAAAGLGAAGLKAGSQSIEDFFLGPAPGEQTKSITGKAGDVAMTGLTAAAGEAGGQVAVKGLQKVLAPAASKMTAAGRSLLEKFNKQNMPVSPDVVNPSPVTSWFRKLFDMPNTPGNFVANRQRAKLAKVMMDARNEFVTDTLKLPKASRAVAGELKEAETAAYDAVATAAGGKETRYAVPHLQEFLGAGKPLTQVPVNDVVAGAEIGQPAGTQAALTWREFTSQRMGAYMKEHGGHGPAIRKIAEEWKKYKQGLPGMGKLGTQTETADLAKEGARVSRGAIEVTGSSELKDALIKARKELAESGTLEFGMIQDIMAKKYKNFGKLSEEQKWVRESLKKALEQDLNIINAATDSAVKTAQEAAKQATITKAGANASLYVEGMLQKATVYDAATGETMFHPKLFKDTVDRAIPTLKRRLPYGATGKNQLELIQKFADEMMLLSTDMTRLKNAPKLSLLEKGAVIGGVGTFASYNPATAAAIAVPAGFQTWAAHSMMKPNGVMKKWLTTGIKSSLLEEMTKAGAKGLSLELGGNP